MNKEPFVPTLIVELGPHQKRLTFLPLNTTIQTPSVVRDLTNVATHTFSQRRSFPLCLVD